MFTVVLPHHRLLMIGSRELQVKFLQSTDDLLVL